MREDNEELYNVLGDLGDGSSKTPLRQGAKRAPSPAEVKVDMVRMRAEAKEYVENPADELEVDKIDSENELLGLILSTEATKEKSGTEKWWKEKAQTVFMGDMTPLHMTARMGHVEMFKALLRKGNFTKDGLRKTVIEPVSKGTHAGTTIIFAAAMCGCWEILEEIKKRGEYTAEEWRHLMRQPVRSRESTEDGLTPLYAMAAFSGDEKRQEAAFNYLFQMAEYANDAKSWRADMVDPLGFGKKARGKTLLYAAASVGGKGTIARMFYYGSYSNQEWITEITTPLKGGKERGLAPIDIAVYAYKQGDLSRIAVLNEMLKPLTKEQRAAVLKRPFPNIDHVEALANVAALAGRTILELVPELAPTPVQGISFEPPVAPVQGPFETPTRPARQSDSSSDEGSNASNTSSSGGGASTSSTRRSSLGSSEGGSQPGSQNGSPTHGSSMKEVVEGAVAHGLLPRRGNGSPVIVPAVKGSQALGSVDANAQPADDLASLATFLGGKKLQ